MMQLGYVGQTMVVRVTLDGFAPVEIEVPVKCSFDSIFHQIDLKLRAQGFKGEVHPHQDLPVFWSKKDTNKIESPDE